MHRYRTAIAAIMIAGLLAGASSCSSTDEVPVDMPQTQAYGLAPADFDRLKFPEEETVSGTAEGNAGTEAVITDDTGSAESGIMPDTGSTESYGGDAGITEEPASDDSGTPGIRAEGKDEGIPSAAVTGNHLATDDAEERKTADGSIYLAGEGGGTAAPDNQEAYAESGTGHLAGDGQTGAAGSGDNAEALGTAGFGWIEEEPEERRPYIPDEADGFLEELRAYHDDVWTEKAPSAAGIMLKEALPYILAGLAAVAFAAVAFIAVRLSSGTLIPKRERERIEKEELKEEEELRNAPVIDMSKGRNIFQRPSENADKEAARVRINDGVSVSKEALIAADQITLGDLLDTDTPPYPEEETLNGLIRHMRFRNMGAA